MPDEVLCTSNDPTSLMIALLLFLEEVEPGWEPDEVPTLDEVSAVMNRAQAVVMPTGGYIDWDGQGQYVIMEPPPIAPEP